ncbi:class I SAM-dependent methyltransferase [Ilumatobacter sp.]|uniref:class I SAM-dependent methyltransferase n=1 Tax=Ilumatobacter sp. TaxID=1967498 RepID=UPI003C43AFC2
MTTPADLRADFNQFSTSILDPERLAQIAAAAEVRRDWLSATVETSIAESRHTLHVIENHLDAADRLLEVGSGLGITSAFLAASGFDITSIEPGGPGFERHQQVNPLLRASLGIDHPHHFVAVEDVDRADIRGAFDLIFSNNVIEHVDDVTRALTTLNEMLKTGGIMIHHCPNYRVPYEPHFGIPLLPWRPAATAKFLPERISSSGLWASLNFVTTRTVTDVGEQCGAGVQFEQGVLADAFARLREPEFGERHPILRRFAAGLSVIDPVVRRIPASWSTPMTFTWQPPKPTGSRT